ncbi:hypothetical protein [Brevibacillus sp. Leaf182]|uniref:hypothetical protein n=1 Tax=Brevibacillus sp. Leaf182 TaxID=1736290 RepID=UPI00070165CC|nr:hypothetical protein [Brevibacillus sp. Leaf182]RAT97023.1 hypothetical protein ASG16_015175 [Brevibacillus sp. Leaf182]
MWQINFSILYSHNTIDEIVRKGYVVCIRIGKWIAATVTQLNHGQMGVRKASVMTSFLCMICEENGTKPVQSDTGI